MNCSLWTADVTDWVKRECVSNWLAHSVENLAEDADGDFFSRVLHNENHVLHPLLPERNDHGYELRCRRHERDGLFLITSNDAKRNFIYTCSFT